MRLRSCIVPVLLVLAMTGCRGFLVEPEPPEVRLSSLALEELGLFEQRYRVGLRLTNPNDYALRVSEMRFDLDVDGHAVADGITMDGINLQALGEGDVEVIVRSSTTAVAALLQQWSGGARDGLDYRVSGSLRLAGWGIRVPFERSGRVQFRSE